MTSLTLAVFHASAPAGDSSFATYVLAPMGCTVTQTSDRTTVTGPPPGTLLTAVALNMADLTDAFLTLAVLAATAVGTTTISGIANQRVKECDRIHAVATELQRCGVPCAETPDGLIVTGLGTLSRDVTPPARIRCYDDHRVAMAFGVLACAWRGVVVSEPRCVDKTFPTFWNHLARVPGVVVSGCSVDDDDGRQLPPVAACACACACAQAWAGCRADDSVVVVGMRGAGKSWLGSRLAAHLGWALLDLDAELTRVVGCRSGPVPLACVCLGCLCVCLRLVRC